MIPAPVICQRSSDHRAHQIEVSRDFTFALLLQPLISSEPAEPRVATLQRDPIVILGGVWWTAGPLDQLEPSTQRYTPWICEWKCRRQNDSLMFSGRGYAQMRVRENVRYQRAAEQLNEPNESDVRNLDPLLLPNTVDENSPEARLWRE